jgi:hypothetical protein
MFATDRRLWWGGGGNGGWPCHYVTYTLIKLSNNWDDVNAAHLLIKKKLFDAERSPTCYHGVIVIHIENIRVQNGSASAFSARPT